MLVCTAAQMREIVRTAIVDFGLPGVVLMEIAGRGVVAVLSRMKDLSSLRVVILCGPGNNGGDGFVIARHLISRGAKVTVFLVADHAKVKGDALINLQILERMGAKLLPLTTQADLERAESVMLHAQVVVDALLGTGITKPVDGELRQVIERANRCPCMKIAVDIPSGLCADTGQVLGVAFSADHTVTFGYPKVGLVTHPGVIHTGKLHMVDIGIPSVIEQQKEFAAEVLDARRVSGWLEQRPAWGHKGTYGHLLVVAGSVGKTGAALLAGEAALRAGTGLVTIASTPGAMRAMEAKTVECMLAPLVPQGMELDGSDQIFNHFRALLQGKTAVAIGPGIPRGPGMQAFLGRLVRESPVPVVIDADGLNELAHDLGALKEAMVPILLTPHPGEMARLTGETTETIQADRLGIARDFAQKHGVYLALKGFRTVLSGPDGKVLINPTGNSGMGSGGTGDVLTGLVGSFMAQQHAPMDALAIGVYVHGLAGDKAAEERGQRGMVASDLMNEVVSVLKGWE